ncbi:MAG TPA: 2-oxoglutarate dehydrogenase complex dihydrolipoyllysine-residue succinyltransferase, partial [Pirellulales bacterium]|nr:2-oxoglutarate dehydrogenase complex dihydrolipoyllysine-residue succinyltransferase [Pirellulales bacterium]
VEIETDKATVEVSAPIAGRITKVLKKAGDSATVGEVIGYMEEESASAPAGTTQPSNGPTARTQDQAKSPAAAATAGDALDRVMPAARRELAQQGVKPEEVKRTGPGGRMLKEDVSRAASDASTAPVATPAAKVPAKPARKPSVPAKKREPASGRTLSYAEWQQVREAEGDNAPGVPSFKDWLAERDAQATETVAMTPLRRRVAERLVEAQHAAALLTTFNEIDMSGVMALRAEHKDKFQERHGVKLGFMSFFVKATIEALKALPQLNAQIHDQSIVYHNYYDIGIAVSSAKGLLVPILREAERMTFAAIETAIEDFGRRARENKIKLEELEGGTFTISNGGVFGSLLSTPIINPPQSGILGLHAIQDRPVARDGQVVIRPMMYVALSYDHRIVDGREAVTFLRRVKEGIEDPARLLLEI